MKKPAMELLSKRGGRKNPGDTRRFPSENDAVGLLKKPGGRKKQVQARGKTPRSQSLFFTAVALLVRLIEYFNSPPVPEFFATVRACEPNHSIEFGVLNVSIFSHAGNFRGHAIKSPASSRGKKFFNITAAGVFLIALLLCPALARCEPADGAWRYFRKSFHLKETPVSARACVAMSAPQSFFISINGARAAQAAPGAGRVVARDISGLVHKGKNAVSVMARNGDRGEAPPALALVLEYGADDRELLVLDGQWKALWHGDDAPDSGAAFDARLAPPLQTRPVNDYADHAGLFMQYADWTHADYDDDSWTVQSAAGDRDVVAGCADIGADARPQYSAFEIEHCDMARDTRCTPAAVSPDSNGIPVPVAPGRSLRLKIAPTGGGASGVSGMATLRFFAAVEGIEIYVNGMGRFITRQGLQTWDLFAFADEMEVFSTGPERGVFLLDAGVWFEAGPSGFADQLERP